MRWGTVRTVLAKELRETLRDRRTLFMMLVIPTLLYPAMMVLAEQLTLFGQRQLGAEQARVAVSGADPALVRFLDADSAIRVIAADSASPRAIREGRVEAALVIEPTASTGDGSAARPLDSTRGRSTDPSARPSAAPLADSLISPVMVPAAAERDEGTRRARILYDASEDRSQRAQQVTRDRVEAWGDTLLSRRLRESGLPETFARPLAVADSSVATAEETGGYALGRFLPLILVMMTLLGAFYPAIDLAAGEKERGTLETLLTAAVPAREIVAGKFAAVAIIGMLAAAANLVSMLLTFQSGVFRFARAANIRFTLPLDSALLILLALIPLSILFAALFLGIAVRAQSFKEAQNALTPAQLAATLPVLVVTLPGIEFTPALAMVPVVGLAMFFRELMAGGAPAGPSILAVVSTMAYAALALVFAARAFGREDVLFGAGSGQTTRGGGSWAGRMRTWRQSGRGVPLPAEALAFIAAIALLYFHLGARLQGENAERGLLISQWGLLALPAVAFVVLGPYHPRAALALRAPRPRALAAAVLIALGGIPLGWLIGWLQMHLWEGGLDALGPLQTLLTATDGRRALWLLFLVALTPAICEELVFRGVLLQSLGREMRAWPAILVTAAVFGAFHLSFETALRFLPTAWIGLLMGYVAWHARSVGASMLMHFINNAAVVVLLWQPSVQKYAIREDGLSWPTVMLGAVLLGTGFWLMPRRGPEPAGQGAPVDAAM